MEEKLPVPKDLGKQNKRHHIIAVNGRDRSCGKFIKSGRILRNEKKSGAGKYNYGTIVGDETKVYVNDQDGILNKDLINHDALILDQFHGTSTVSIVPPKEDVDEDEDDDEYYDEEGGDDDADEWGDEEEE